jgi:lysophospholipase L1-like esterase
MGNTRRWLGRAAVWVPLAFVMLLAIEALVTVRREYLATPEFAIEGLASPEQPSGGDPLRMVMLGDSTVAGLGAETAAESLVLQTAQRVAEQTGRDVVATGLGVSGARTAGVERDQVPRIEPGTDIVVIVIGSNDVTHLTPPWRMDDDTASLLAAARRLAPDAVVALGGIPLFGEATALNEPLRSVVDAYASVLRGVQATTAAGADGVVFVNIAVEASPRFVGVPDAMSGDGFHPAATGYGFWADALAPAIVAALA